MLLKLQLGNINKSKIPTRSKVMYVWLIFIEKLCMFYFIHFSAKIKFKPINNLNLNILKLLNSITLNSTVLLLYR